MTPIALSDKSRLILATVFAALTVAGGGGCAATGQFMSNFATWTNVKAQEKQELGDIRRDTRYELSEQRQEALRSAAERDVVEARMAAERRVLEAEMCRANQEALNERLRSNIRETVESKLAFNVQQGLEVGELEVDTEQLQQLLRQREQPPPSQPVRGKPPCSCCDQPCGCEPGLLRRLCPRCRHKPCAAENKCGGPGTVEALTQAPVKQPLRPAEIPLKLPVRLSFGMQNPQVQETRVKRQPGIEVPPEAVRQPCPHCVNPGQTGAGKCVDGPAPTGDASSSRRGPAVDVIEIPKPLPEDQTFRSIYGPSFTMPANLQVPTNDMIRP